jgi:hypothetical protein
MTSASQGSWADDGLKGFLGRKRPTGLGPTGPDRGSLLILPGLLVQAPFTRWASTAARRAGCHMRPSGLLPSRYQGRGGPAPPQGARRARRRRSLLSGYGGGSGLGLRWGALASAAASRPKPGSRFASTVRRPGSRRGGAVNTTRRSHTRRRDGSPASVQISGVSSGLPRRARSCTDKPMPEGLHGLGMNSRARRGVERRCAELRWWRDRGHGAHGCGRPAPAPTSTCIRKPAARRPVHSKVTHAIAAARPETRRG